MLDLPCSDSFNPWRHRFALLTAVLTFVLLGMGGLVTSHGVGMAVPDWPNTYGYNMFFFPISQWVGGIFYEHTHRLAASGVGLCTSVLALWLFGRRARPFLRWFGLALFAGAAGLALGMPGRGADALVLGATALAALTASFFWPGGEPAPRWLRSLGVAAFLAVVLQGVLGGLRVVLFKDQIGILHATLGQLFFVLTCALALFTSQRWQGGAEARSPREDSVPPELARLFLAASILILAQLVLGATMRHQHAGLAIPDFPLAYGKLLPALNAQSVAHYNEQRIEILAVKPITAFQIVLQMVHRAVAVVILALVALAAARARRLLRKRHPLSRLALGWVGLVVLQAVLGAATIWSNKAADVATAHVLVGALSLALGGMLSIVSVREPAFAGREINSIAAVGRGEADSILGSPAPSSTLCRTTTS